MLAAWLAGLKSKPGAGREKPNPGASQQTTRRCGARSAIRRS